MLKSLPGRVLFELLPKADARLLEMSSASAQLATSASTKAWSERSFSPK